MVILYQACANHLDTLKNMAARGRGLFSLYFYIENFKNLVRNRWADFYITWQKCFLWWSSVKIVQAVVICQKSMAARGWGLFSLYIYIENFNDHLVRNHWTDFSITSQECFFCNSLPRLFKLSWFIKNCGRQGAGLYFLIYLNIVNFKNLLRNHRTDFIMTLQKCSLVDPLPIVFK